MRLSLIFVQRKCLPGRIWRPLPIWTLFCYGSCLEHGGGDVQLLPHLPHQRHLPVRHHLHVPHRCPHVHEALPGCSNAVSTMIEVKYIIPGSTCGRLSKCHWCLFWSWRRPSLGNDQHLLQRALVLGGLLHGEGLETFIKSSAPSDSLKIF